MHVRFAIALAGLACSSPAFATGGFQCRPLAGAGPVLDVTIGHTVSARPLSVTVREGRRILSTRGGGDPLVLGQSWIDGQHLWLDLLDSQALRYEGKLRATFNPKMRGRPAVGTFVRGGKTYRVRCVEA
jgi:hypothetical protein